MDSSATYGEPATGPPSSSGLQQLITLLELHPPPIDYQARRAHAGQVDASAEAIDAAHLIHPSPRPAIVLVRQLCERFTGGDITYAPESLRVDAASPDSASFRRLLAV